MTDQTPYNNCNNATPPVIEGFRVLANLGHGATSSVWKAEQVSLNRLVVIKVLSERLTHEPEDVTLFKAEAHLAANFKHAGIVQVYDFGQSKTDQRYYFVMEYISGYSVGDWIRRKGKITEHEALVVTQAVADALNYAWDLSRIVHCDIKPDNIMVDGDGTVKVADLGLAHTVKTMVNQPGADANEVIITGTPNYMAPEQVRGSDPIDCRTDIYALGASLYHMVTGQLPFGDSPPDVVLERQLQEAFEYPQKVNPDLSTSVTRLILKMTAKEPTARFQTWNEVLAEVIRLERQIRQQAAVSTQHATGAGTAALAEQAPSAGSKNEDALAGGGLKCRYCGKPIQPQALYCGFCGKSVAVLTKEQIADQKEVTIRLKPIQENAKASAKPAMAPRLRHASGHWYASWIGNIRLVLSLCLLAFLVYYTYQKVKYDHDVIIPIKAAIIRAVQSVQDKSRLGLQEGAQWSRRFLSARIMAKPAISADMPKVEPEATPGPDQTPAPAESPESTPVVGSEATQESESLPPSAAATVPIAVETPVSATSEPPPSEMPPSASGPSKPEPEPATEPAKSSQEVEYERILQTCKQQQPKAGDRITLRFKNGRAPVEGVFERTTTEGVKVKVPAGIIEYPFRLMSAESRLMYFPEERARRLQRQ